MSYGLIATLIVLAIVIGAITTKKCEAFLIAGSMVGAIVLWKQDFLTKWVSTLEGSYNSISFLHGLVSKAWWHEKGIRACFQNRENIQ